VEIRESQEEFVSAASYLSHYLVVYSRDSTREPLAVLGTLLQTLSDSAAKVTVVNISPRPVNSRGRYGVFLGQVLSTREEQQILESFSQKFGADLITVSLDHSEVGEPLLPGEKQELAESAMSSTLSYFRDDSLRGSGYEKVFFNNSVWRGEALFSWLLRFLGDHESIDSVVIPNGRAASQRACLLAATRAQKTLLFYEIGRASNKAAYIGRYRIHDREGTQREALEKTEAHSDEEILAIASDWLAERSRPRSDVNQFSRAWDSSARSSQVGKANDSELAVFFTSSADEFTALGPEWDLQEWRDQYEAFDSVLSHFETRGVDCLLRVHPNLANKSPRHFWSEVQKIRNLSHRHPYLQIIWPHQALNSYELVAQADFIIVARSTIGLEASLMGKCVWTTTPARYDQVADIRPVWSESAVNTENLSAWNANPLGAARWVAHLVLSDFPFSEEMKSISPWNSANPPVKYRVRNFLSARPWRHKVHLLHLEVAKILQSRLPIWFLARR
jgi:fructose-specific component phosphotransferase system IIB-like protein